MTFAPIELSDADEIECIRSTYKHITACHAFPSLYLWREALGLSIAMEKNFFVVRCSFMGENCYYFPCGDRELTDHFIRSHMAEEDFRLCNIREIDAAYLQENFPGRFELTYDRDSCEYIYDREEQGRLPGGRFAKRRTKLHKFLREHSAQCVPLTEDNALLARRITLEWAIRQKSLPVVNDVHIALEALSMIRTLRLSGVLVFTDGEPAAYAMGCLLTPAIYDLCFMKQLPAYHGLSAYVMQELCRGLPGGVTTVNLEDDLGIEGIRIHKSEMCPVRLDGMWEGKTIRNEQQS
jgi:hypothetical protein